MTKVNGPRGVRLTRAQFLIGGISLAVLRPPLVASARAGDGVSLKIDEVAPGVFVHSGRHALAAAGNRGDICNISFVVGSRGVAVIDTGGSALVGRDLLAAIKSRTSHPVTHVISTHMHPDHVLGNIAFSGEKPVFVGHHKLLRALAERSESYLESAREQLGDAFTGTEVVLPTQGVDATLDIDLGDRKLLLTARATAHTNNDLTVRDSSSDTLFTGDLIFAQHLPTLDGSLRGWLKVLGQLEDEPAARIVPGHGPTSLPWPAGGADTRRYLEVLAADVRKAISAGQTMTAAMETAAQSERDKWELFSEHNARNVSAAFAELEWE